MNEYTPRRRWGFVLSVLLLSALAGIVAYNIGLSHGITQSVAVGQAPVVPPYAYYAYRPWGFGSGFPIFLLIIVWFAAMRSLRWCGGGPWRHRYYMDARGIPPAFDDWHRRAHEHMKEGPSADDSGRRG